MDLGPFDGKNGRFQELFVGVLPADILSRKILLGQFFNQ